MSKPDLKVVRSSRSDERTSRGLKGLTTFHDKAVLRQLKGLAFEHDTTNVSLVREALNMLFAKYGKPQIA
jgi:hypothetical protein